MNEDDTLVLLFMCCHPALTTPSAIALTLRAVGGLTTAEIASAFLVPEATMAQRISRAKAEHQDVEGSVLTAERSGARRTARVGAARALSDVQRRLCVASGATLHRTDLSNEAIRLARLLRDLLPDDGEVAGLLALMLLTDARRAARTGPHGEIIPLDEQDRSLWNRAQIAEGLASLGRGAVTRHGRRLSASGRDRRAARRAARADETDWRRNRVTVRRAIAGLRQSDGRAESRDRRRDGARSIGGARDHRRASMPIRGSPGTIGSTLFAAISTSARAISPVLSSISAAQPSVRRVVRSGII